MRGEADLWRFFERIIPGHRTVITKCHAGRFAPSPTGDLHFGSLVSAVASFLQTKHVHGMWLIRMEDIDPPREVPGSATRILNDLGRLGLNSDRPVLCQSTRTRAYESAVETLLSEGKAFWCGCSRNDLPPSGIYPGTCRNGLAPGKFPRAVRLKVKGSTIRFTDLIRGTFEEKLEHSAGDFIIRRADGLPAYQLAVVVDDAFQGITEVVRGSDLLESTARQIHLQQALGLPTPSYLHHPLAVSGDGKKLGKRFGSDPVGRLPAAEAVSIALRFLGQKPPGGMELKKLWSWACEHWQAESIPPVKCMRVELTSQA
jgi:glutamyl-Q tRNA(Asp) synthetase